MSNILKDYIKNNNPVNNSPTPLRNYIKRNNFSTQYDSLFAPIAVPTGDEIGKSMFDDNIPFSELENLNEIRSQRQPWIAKASAGLGRVGSKALTEIAKMPGVIIGVGVGAIGEAIDSENNEFMKTAFNNGWIKAMNELNEDINSEVLPVYVSKAVSEGNLWDAITSIDFWATEGADGLGYIVSMLAPGAVINRFKLGSKALSGVNKLAKMSSKTDEALNVLNKVGITPKNADLHMGTIANTIFEAGAEAGYAMDSYEEELKSQLDSGQITFDEYQIKMSKSGEIGRNIFLSNAAILLGPNAIMSKMLWGKPRSKTPQSLIGEAGKIKPLDPLTKKQKITNAGNEFAKGVAREGFFEEGLQSTTENYFTENADKTTPGFLGAFEDLGNFIGDLPAAYFDMLDTTEGQKAILLGALFGGGMQAITNYRTKDKEIDQTNKLIEKANDILDDFYTVFNEDSFQKTDKGNVRYKNGRPLLDSQKVLNKMKGLSSMEAISEIYDQALQEGNTDILDKIEDITITNLIKPFIINDNLGTDVLRASLQEQLKTVPEADETFINNIISKADKLKNSYELFNAFSNDLIKLNNKDATNQDRIDYYNKLVNKYLNINSNKLYLDEKINYLKSLRSDILTSKGLQANLVTEDETLLKEESKDRRLKTVNNKIRNLESAIKNVDKQLNGFWNDKSINSEFNKIIAERKELQKQEAKEKELNDLFDRINNATSLEDLDNIVPEDSELSNIIDIKKKEKAAEIIKEKEIADKEASENNEESSAESKAKTSDEIERIAKQYNIGETVTLSTGPMANQPLTVKSINKASVTFKNEKGSSVTVPFTELPIKSVEQKYSIEGTDNTEVTFKDEVSTRDKSIQSRYDVKVISTDAYNNYDALPFVDKKVVDFERTPINKKGNSVGFEINLGNKLTRGDFIAKLFKAKIGQSVALGSFNINKIAEDLWEMKGYTEDETIQYTTEEVYDEYLKVYGEPRADRSHFSKNQQIALNKFDNNDFSDKNFLYNHLPINVKLNDSVSAPIATLSEKSDKYNEIFSKGTKILRQRIIDQLAEGIDIKNITSEIIGQKNGQIQLEDTVVENSLLGLYEINGNIKNIKTDNLYVVDDNGALRNVNDDILPANRMLAPGEIYLKIHTANGTEFPLKLNVKKINQSQAEVLYELYKYRFQDISEGKSTRLKDTTDEIFKMVQDRLPNEIEWFKNNKKKVEDITIKDIVDFLIWDGTKSSKSQVRFIKGKLYTGKQFFTKETFSNEESKSDFINFLTNNKRRHIRYKQRGSESLNDPHFNNRSYVEYLINNEILNTNAKVNQPTFAGDTSIYISKDKIKVDGKLLESAKNIFDTVSNEPQINEKIESGINLAKFGVKPKETKSELQINEKIESGINLSKFGVKTPSKKQEIKTKVVKGYKFLTRENLDELSLQIQNGDFIISSVSPIGYKGKAYFITKNTYYLINADDNIIEENINLMSSIVDNLNKVYSGKTLDKEKILNIWKKRIENISNSNTIKKPVKNESIINIDNLSDKQIDAVRVQLSIAFKQYVKPLQLIGNKNISSREKLKETIEFLESKNISKEEIKVKCGI